jgi:hypothetical protein
VEDMVTVRCYGKTEIYTKKEAGSRFLFFLSLSEGIEREKYKKIYLAILDGEKNIDGDV